MPSTILSSLAERTSAFPALINLGTVNSIPDNGLQNYVSIQLLGSYEDQGKSVLAFMITSKTGYSISGIPSITSSNPDKINVVMVSKSRATETTKYYKVNTGFDLSSDEFSLTFNIQYNNASAGTWVFRKGNVGEDELKLRSVH